MKITSTSAVHFLLKRGGGLYSKGAYFRVSTVYALLSEMRLFAEIYGSNNSSILHGIK